MSATEAVVATRGTSNGNARGSAEDRRRRREWLVETYRADTDVKVRITLVQIPVDPENHPPGALLAFQHVPRTEIVPRGEGQPACRCYRCGDLLTVDTVTVDRIIPGCHGGTYRRNNIRPACGPCNSETGGALAHIPKRGKR